MAETIYPLITSEDVLNYLTSNTELIDDDHSMADDELDATINRIVAKSTEGRLFEMLRDAFEEDWYFDKVLDIVDSCMYDFVSECLNEED